MPVPIHRLVKEHGLDPASLKAAFDADTIENRPLVKKLVEEIRDGIRNGIDRNRRDYRLFKAMDWAYDQPFYQVSYTQLRGLLSDNPDEKKVMSLIESWGLTHLLPVVMENGKACCGADGKTKHAVNLPVFFNIFVPIVMAYVTIRWAKLFNDRNLIPLYKYEPVQFTKENRLRCEVVTQAIQRQSSWFDYPADEKQTILQTLIYGLCINFPREAWFVEKQEDESGKEVIVREGLRFNMPHPSRIYYDLYHRLNSLNSNSGCAYVGYWELVRYKDIQDGKLYWNKGKIAFGGSEWFDVGVRGFLSEAFPCTMSFPDGSGDGHGGVGALDRQNDSNYYTTGNSNSATLLTQDFRRIIPKDYGLGSYEHPVWFRFVFASDSTVIWAEPLAFDRFPTYAYDADFNRARFRSLALEVMPFQDHVSNFLTNWIAAVKQNLSAPVFYDKEMVAVEHVQALENRGHKQLDGRVFIPFSSTQNYRKKMDQQEAFYSPQLTHHNTAELAQLISGVLNMLDRIMQLSPQEVGQSATHEQTAEESRIIAGNTSTRVSFTGSFIDDGDYAKKVMLYDALMAYGDEEITVGISSAFAATEEEFKKLIDSVGLTISDKSAYDPQNPDAMPSVTAKKSALRIETFASTRDGENRINNPAIADAMSKIFLSIANNPILIQSVGTVQLIELLNQIVVSAGLPKEFRLRGKNIDTNAPAADQQKEMSQVLTQFAEQVKQSIEASQAATLKAAGEQTQQVVAEAAQGIAQQVAPAIQQVSQQMSPLAEGVAQANQDNQIQQQQINELAKAVAQLNQLIRAAAAPIDPVSPQMVPLHPDLQPAF
jgi:hypothetical protein